MDVDRLLDPFETTIFEVRPEEAGRRLDHVLADRLPFASRSRLAEWIKQRRVTIDGRVEARPSHPLTSGERIACTCVKTGRDLDASIDDLLRFEIAVATDEWLAVEKPPGVPCHPTGGTIKRTMLTAAALALRGRYESGGPWLPHRLDRETSGLLLIALTRASSRRLGLGFASGRIRRHYVARVDGCVEATRVGTEDPLDPTWRRLDGPLRLLPGKPKRVAVGHPGAESLTRVRVLSRSAATTDLDVEPVTGRLHQIRVHLAHAGHPIVGDPLYGRATAESRMLLHAYRLEIPDESSCDVIESSRRLF